MTSSFDGAVHDRAVRAKNFLLSLKDFSSEIDNAIGALETLRTHVARDEERIDSVLDDLESFFNEEDEEISHEDVARIMRDEDVIREAVDDLRGDFEQDVKEFKKFVRHIESLYDRARKLERSLDRLEEDMEERDL